MRINNITVGNDQPFILIAGPCAIENLNDTLYHAENIMNICDRLNIQLIFKSSFDKANRTSLSSHRGIGIDEGLEILLKVPNNKIYLVRPEKWWKEREIIGRSLIYKKKYELAYKVVSKHSMVEGPEYAAAEWMSGWIALSFLNDPILAVEHFDNFYNNVGYPISLARGAYWLGRSYEKMGSKDLQNKWYQEASKYLTTYYGQLAFLKINPEKTFELDLEQVVDKDYKKKFENKGLVKLIYLLNELNKDKYTKHMLRHLALDDIEKLELIVERNTTAISLLKNFTDQIYVTAGSKEKCDKCLQLGAKAAINYKDEDFEQYFIDQKIIIVCLFYF